MKTKILFILFIFTTALTGTIGAQITQNGKYIIGKDTIVPGREYYLLTPENELMTGKIIGCNPSSILLDDGKNVTEVKKSDIKKIYDEYPGTYEYVKDPVKSLYHAYWSFGAGVVLPEKGHPYTLASTNWNSAEYLTGFNIFASTTLPFSSYTGGRIEADYTFVNTGDNNYTDINYNSIYSSTKGGTWNMFALKFMLGTGDFSDSKFTGQIFIGTGIGVGLKSAMTFQIATKSVYDSTYTNKITNKPAESYGSLVATITADLRYKISGKAGVFIEPQVNFWFTAPNFVTIRAGIYF